MLSVILYNVKLSRINSILVIYIIAINLYVLAAPVIPVISLWWQGQFGNRHEQLTQVVDGSPTVAVTETMPEDNRLIVPSMLINEPIYEGSNITTARKGIWRRPETSTPDQRGNTVLVGHRFTYTNPKGVFYHLDIVRPGQRLAVFWNRQKYMYEVVETKVVKANDLTVEVATVDERLTLYTCTPLWSAKDRLVVIAKRLANE